MNSNSDRYHIFNSLKMRSLFEISPAQNFMALKRVDEQMWRSPNTGKRCIPRPS